jgi:2-amino-4-hydroxy-6-hydroxymethyldihydropteridine diphosphokinase
MPTVYIGLGANLPSTVGPPEATLTTAALRLETLGRVVVRSSLYSTAPVGFADQPRFINAVITLETELAPRTLLEGLLALEREFGRDRAASFPNGPRTLDLDILLFDDQIVSAPDLQIPHPRLADRAFVLVPLSEISPHATDPASGCTVGQLLQSLRHKADNSIDAVVSLKTGVWRAGACRSAVDESGS